MNYGISLLSIIPMRKEPREQSEMISQLLFGESYQVLHETDNWISILTQFDHYTGWINRKLYVEISESSYHDFSIQYQPVLASMLMIIESSEAPPFSILAGSTLPGFNSEKNLLAIENREFHIRQTIGDALAKNSKSFPAIVNLFMNAPYLWGGRTVFGCDCSGFVQSVYKIMGIALERDSSQQVHQGKPIASMAEAKQGDLAFFANEEGKLCHVGMIFSPDEIVHCSGYVHKDKLDDTGILNATANQYTHRLFAIKRIKEKW
jgi:gamma-D-glutamyl-L-lysine dipeptidyl-peptidase